MIQAAIAGELRTAFWLIVLSLIACTTLNQWVAPPSEMDALMIKWMILWAVIFRAFGAREKELHIELPGWKIDW